MIALLMEGQLWRILHPAACAKGTLLEEHYHSQLARGLREN
jgi:hypothetical protein